MSKAEPEQLTNVVGVEAVEEWRPELNSEGAVNGSIRIRHYAKRVR